MSEVQVAVTATIAAGAGTRRSSDAVHAAAAQTPAATAEPTATKRVGRCATTASAVSHSARPRISGRAAASGIAAVKASTASTAAAPVIANDGQNHGLPVARTASWAARNSEIATATASALLIA